MRRTIGGRGTAALLLVGAVLGCRDVGLQGNIPLQEAENRQYRYATYEMTEAAGHGANVVRFDARNWMASAVLERIPERLLRPVGDADGTPVFAPVWTEPPYASIYAPAGRGHWHTLRPIP